MQEKIGDALEEFRAERIIGADGLPTITNGFSRERLDLTDVPYFSRNRISLLNKSPRHFWWQYILGNKSKDTPAKKKGNLVHWALLQPEEFLARYVIEKKFSGKGSKAAKTAWKKLIPKNALLLSEKEAVDITHMIESIRSHGRATKLLTNGTPEVHFYFTDPVYKDENGRPILWYGIMDFYRSGNWVVEVKTTRDARWFKFQNDAYEFGYHVQKWLYKRAAKVITGQDPQAATIAVENLEPYCTEVYPFSKLFLERADIEVRSAFDTYIQCKKSGIWHGYSEPGAEPRELNEPGYLRYRYEEEIEGE